MKQESISGSKTLSPHAVADYLRDHPEFFIENESLLSQLQIPHIRGTAISLVERQLMVLRDENRQLQRKLGILIETAKSNEEINLRIQRLIVALLGVNKADEFFDTLYEILTREFSPDAVALRLFEVAGAAMEGRPEFAEYDAQVFSLFESVLGTNQPVSGRLSEKQSNYLFPETRMGSAVLIPLGTPKPRGLLALGAIDMAHFHSGMRTDLLKYMGELITQLLKPWQV